MPSAIVLVVFPENSGPNTVLQKYKAAVAHVICPSILEVQ